MHKQLGKAIATQKPLVDNGANLRSVKDQQDDLVFLHRVPKPPPFRRHSQECP